MAARVDTSETESLYFDVDTRMNMYEFNNLSPLERMNLYPDLGQIRANALAVACLMKIGRILANPPGYILDDKVPTLSDVVSNMSES